MSKQAIIPSENVIQKGIIRQENVIQQAIIPLKNVISGIFYCRSKTYETRLPAKNLRLEPQDRAQTAGAHGSTPSRQDMVDGGIRPPSLSKKYCFSSVLVVVSWFCF